MFKKAKRVEEHPVCRAWDILVLHGGVHIGLKQPNSQAIHEGIMKFWQCSALVFDFNP
ncbi:hypothetical protein RUM44_004773 [Polyplax serrata]|uniref:Uncharacterized protein n=1 Tax=Polyplax serrata TaxID=468196 RepID=A0ABR1B3S7_POLSC